MVRNKYNSKQVEVDGIIFDSALESKYYLHLKQLQEQGIVESFEMQKTYLLLEGYTIAGKKRQPIKFTPDFIVHSVFGMTRVIDVKGNEKAISRDFPLRKKLFECRYKIPLDVVMWSAIDGGWIEYEDLKKARRLRAKESAKKRGGDMTNAKSTRSKSG